MKRREVLYFSLALGVQLTGLVLLAVVYFSSIRVVFVPAIALAAATFVLFRGMKAKSRMIAARYARPLGIAVLLTFLVRSDRAMVVGFQLLTLAAVHGIMWALLVTTLQQARPERE